jgi:prepilin-type N-terminal cleavage/methylation domain-containing protein
MKKRYAFTLIETMIAIVVFSIGILAVLRVLT